MTKKYSICAASDRCCLLIVPNDFKPEFLNSMADEDDVPLVLRWEQRELAPNQNPKTAVYRLDFDPRQTLANAQPVLERLLDSYFSPILTVKTGVDIEYRISATPDFDLSQPAGWLTVKGLTQAEANEAIRNYNHAVEAGHSFLIVRNAAESEFLSNWIDRMEQLRGAPSALTIPKRLTLIDQQSFYKS